MTDQPVADNPEADDVGVLTGIGVVELTRWIAGPSAGGCWRTGGPMSSRSNRPPAMDKLLASADVYLTNMGPNSLEAMTHRTP